jgi:hypothetical protein
LEDRTLFAVPAFDHVVVVIEENKSPMNVIGNSAAPYINSLATNGAYLSQSYGTHRPSQPNYLALFSGSNQGVTTNDDVNLGNIANLGSQLIAAGKSFINYSEGLPYVGYTGSTSGSYARKHNPSVSFSNVPSTSNRPFTDFPTDYTKLPTVSFVVPNLDNDSHDGTVGESDVWLQNHIGAYATWAKTHNSLLIVTYDEGDLSDSTNHIPTIFYGPNVQTGAYSNQIKHYNVLRTLEDMYKLTPLANAATAAPIDYIWTGGTPATLNAPNDLVATSISGTQINIAWTDNNTAESGYKIERSTDGVNFYPQAGTGVNGHSYSNTGLTAGKKYYYRVYAVNSTGGRSGFSNVASAVTGTVSNPLGAPTGLAASASSSSQINLSWADNSTAETSFRIERSTDGANFSFLANVGSNVKTYSNTNLPASSKYYYRVQATGSGSSSGWSNTANATTQASGSTAPAAPSALAASAVSTSQINLSWADNSGNETGFRIERSTDGTNFSFLANVGVNVKAYSNTGLPAGTKYYYRVQATGTPNSAFSNVANATTQTSTGGTIAAPTNLAVVPSTSVASALNLSWTDNATNESGYKIERSTDGVNFSPLAGGGANMTFYRNTGLTVGKRYYYRVYAVNSTGGRSGFSNVASAVVPAAAAPVPAPAIASFSTQTINREDALW